MKKFLSAILALFMVISLSGCGEKVQILSDEQLNEIFAEISMADFVMGGSYGGTPLEMLQKDGEIDIIELNRLMAFYDIRGAIDVDKLVPKDGGGYCLDKETKEKLEQGIIDVYETNRLKKLNYTMELEKALKKSDRERFSFLSYCLACEYNQYLKKYDQDKFSEVFASSRHDVSQNTELKDYTPEEVVIIGSYYKIREKNDYTMREYNQNKDLIDQILREYRDIKFGNKPFSNIPKEEEEKGSKE